MANEFTVSPPANYPDFPCELRNTETGNTYTVADSSAYDAMMATGNFEPATAKKATKKKAAKKKAAKK